MNNTKPIDALDYAKDVASRLETVSIEEYFLRRDRKTKWLIEEEWPLACFGKLLYHPDRRVSVLYRGPEGVPDGEIIVEGRQKLIEEWDDVTPVEITSVQYPAAHSVRRELGTTGSYVGPARDIDADIKAFIPEAIGSLKKKYQHQPPYPPNRAGRPGRRQVPERGAGARAAMARLGARVPGRRSRCGSVWADA